MHHIVRTLCAMAALFVLPIAAQASSFTGKLRSLVYGNDTIRVSPIVAGTHPLSCGANATAYTFSGKPFWNEAFLQALVADKTVAIIGAGFCTLGVEEIQSFQVVK